MHHLKNQTYFKLFFIVTIFWNTLNLQVFGINHNPLAWIAIVWGLGLFLFQIAKQEVAWKQYSLWLLLLYLGVTGFATFNNPFHTTSSIQLWLLQAVVLLVVFPNSKKMTIPQLKQEMFLINALVCGLTFFASLASIFLFLANVSYSAHGVTLGLVGNRLFGVYFNSNPASFLAIIVVLFSLIALRNHTKIRWFYLLNIAVQLIYILLSNCRSALLIVLGILLVFTYYFMFKQKKYPWWRQALIMVVISLVFLFGSNLIKELLFLIPKLQGAVFEDGGRFQFDKIVQILSLMRSGLWSNKIEILTLADEISSGRVELYFNSLQAWRASPIFGIGMGSFTQTVRYFNPVSQVMQQNILQSHNLFLESLVVGGVLGFVSFIAFTCKSAFVMWESFRKYEYNRNSFLILCIALVIFVDFAGGMMDYGVFYVYSLNSVLFWLYLGYLFFIYHSATTEWLRLSSSFDLVQLDLLDVTYHNSNQQAVLAGSIVSTKWDLDKQQLYATLLLDYGAKSYAEFHYVAHIECSETVLSQDLVALMELALLQRLVPQLEMFGNTLAIEDFYRSGGSLLKV